MVFVKGHNLGKKPPPHKKECKCFRCTKISWNKGRKGMFIWNKGLKGIHLSIKSEWKKGNIPWNKGKKLSEKHIKNLSLSHRGYIIPQSQRDKMGRKNYKHHNLKGDKVGYVGLHKWLERNYYIPYKCDNPNCIYPRKNSDGKLMIKPKIYHWANKNGNYNRDINNWFTLCPSCHQKYDRERKKYGRATF